MKEKLTKTLDKSRLLDLVKTVTTRSEFKLKYGKEYKSMTRLGITDEIFAHLPKKYNERLVWNLEACATEALKYDNRTEFQRQSAGAFASASKNGWLEEICLHMPIIIRPKGYWTKENILEEAVKHKTLKDFRKVSSGAIDAASVYGWLPEVYKAMGIDPPHKTGKSRKTHSKASIRRAYKQCKTLSEFRLKFRPQFSDSLKLGMQDELIKNLIVKNPKHLY